MEPDIWRYELENCTVTVERVFDAQKPLKELLMELLLQRAEDTAPRD